MLVQNVGKWANILYWLLSNRARSLERSQLMDIQMNYAYMLFSMSLLPKSSM